jgi:hypothetical protein
MWLWRKLMELLFGAKREEEQPQMLNEAPRNHVSLEEMTKEELDALGAQHGIKLDRRKRKATLIKELNENNIFHK